MQLMARGAFCFVNTGVDFENLELLSKHTNRWIWFRFTILRSAILARRNLGKTASNSQPITANVAESIQIPQFATNLDLIFEKMTKKA